MTILEMLRAGAVVSKLRITKCAKMVGLNGYFKADFRVSLQLGNFGVTFGNAGDLRVDMEGGGYKAGAGFGG